MTEDVYNAIRCAVTIAKTQQVTKVAILRIKVQQAGHSEEATDQALKAWADSEARRKQCK